MSDASPDKKQGRAPIGEQKAVSELGDDDLRDGREEGQYWSWYPKEVQLQIFLESAFALIIFIVAGLHLIAIAAPLGHAAPDISRCPPIGWLVGGGPRDDAAVSLWAAVFFGGVLGSNVFATKWLYHSVATKWWHRDRALWRIFVPIQGGVLALFVGLMSLAGVVPDLPQNALARYATGAGLGFFVGLLADNVISAVARLIRAILGQLVLATTRAIGYSEGGSRAAREPSETPSTSSPDS